MTIDEALPADAETIAMIHRSARQTAMPWLPVLHTPHEDLWYFKTIVLPSQKVLVAREGGRAAGFVSFDQGWLNHLYIAPERWGLGLGTKLLDAAKSGSSYLQLWVFQQNAKARQFYSTHGFRERELTDGGGNEEKVPDIRMDWARCA